MTETLGSAARFLRRTVTALLVVVLFGGPTEAASRRARLSEDLAQRLASGSNENASVIVHGNQARLALFLRE